jgi:hypothetical protein
MTEKKADEKSMGYRRRRSQSERVVEAIIGAGVIYIGNSAPDANVRGILFIAGVLVILHALFSG